MQKDEIRCPGQNTLFWKPDDIYDVTCPSCGAPVEFWKDDSKRTCKCGHRFLNPKRDLGCLEYCKYAEQCMPDMFQGENLKAIYRDRLLVGAKIALKPTDNRLKRSQEIAEVAEEILDGESGQPKVVFAATILGDLVLHSQPQELKGASSGEGERPRAIVTKVLAELGTEKEVIDEVCQIIEDKINGTSYEDVNRKVVADAMMVVDLLDKKTLLEEASIERLIERKIQTETGKQVARERLLSE
jgi:hypothetical protein